MAKPLETEYGGLVGKPKPPKKPNPIPTAPGGRVPKPAGGYTTTSSTASTKPSTSSKAGGGGGRGGGASGYEKRAIAREEEAKAKAADRYMQQAKNLESQARALQHALRVDFRKGLDQQLADINQILRQQQGLIREGFQERYDQLKGAKSDNDKASVSQSGINDRNMVRERNSAISEAMNLGAGESDVLAAQMMSLRNWHANQTEIQRGYYDTLRSINSSLTDLEVDTRTALANNALQANADKEQLWTQYHDQRSETLTQLGNVRGQQADYYVQAAEMGKKGAMGKADERGRGGKKDDGPRLGAPGKKDDGPRRGPTPAQRDDRIRPGSNADRAPLGRQAASPSGRQGPFGLTTWAGGGGNQQGSKGPGGWVGAAATRGQKALKDNRAEQRRDQRQDNRAFINQQAANAAQARDLSSDAFMDAAKEQGKSWDNPGIPDGIMDWEGRPEFRAMPNNLARIQAARTTKLDKVPEGATLRKW